VWDAPQSPRNRLSYARTFFHGLSASGRDARATAGMALRNIRSLLLEDENEMKTHGFVVRTSWILSDTWRDITFLRGFVNKIAVGKHRA